MEAVEISDMRAIRMIGFMGESEALREALDVADVD
jgi:hypothetical protein